MSTELTNKSDWEKFQELQKNSFAQNSIPTMPAMKFHGDVGGYSESIFDKDSNEWVKTDLGKSMEGVILAVKYLARWKYNENATHDIRTREFSDFQDEPIELLKINNADRSAPPEVKHFDNYGQFKGTYGVEVPETDQMKYPHDLWVSLYVLVDGQVKRFRFAGTSRTEWFNYKNAVDAPTLVLTGFGTSDPIEMKTTDAAGSKRSYYTATFSNLGEIPEDMRPEVMEASTAIATWMNAWKEKKSKPAEEQVVQIAEPTKDEEDILENCPF